MKYPDLGAEIPDLLLRLEGAKWVICMGVCKDDFIVSIRSRSRKVGAGILAQNLVADLGSAGGHATMAGGQIQLNQKDPYQLSEQCIINSWRWKSPLNHIPFFPHLFWGHIVELKASQS